MRPNLPTADTIVAVATAPGGVAWASCGSVARRYARSGEAVTGGALPAPRVASLVRFRDAAGDTLDEGLALFFEGPHSYTGEDVLELQGHGGPVVLEQLVARCVALGARRAGPANSRNGRS
jgi:tRNA modification GTPase